MKGFIEVWCDKHDVLLNIEHIQGVYVRDDGRTEIVLVPRFPAKYSSFIVNAPYESIREKIEKAQN